MFKTNRVLRTIVVRLNHTWVKPEGDDTKIIVYNCTAKKQVPLIVGDKNFIKWYTCGPTVYDSAHIGHASCYVKLDILQKILKHRFGANIVSVMNITDIDDKIIARSNERGVPSRELAKYYEEEFWRDMEALNVERPGRIVRVTESIPTILDFVGRLYDKGGAYRGGDGSVYFDVAASSAPYGKLQNIGGEAGGDKAEFKRAPADFVLWKNAKEGEPFWESRFGKGRPGWHTECSAIASDIFGSPIDVHAGGIDLRFPHHENEEAQCCAYHGTPQWTNYWLHTGHLQLKDDTKMSKSLKNTVSIERLLQTCSADVFRMVCLTSHYRYGMEFSDELLAKAESHLRSYRNFVHDARAHANGVLKASLNGDVLLQSLLGTVQKVEESLRDDFDMAAAIKAIDNLISTTNKMLHGAGDSGGNGSAILVAISNYVVDLLSSFGLTIFRTSTEGASASETEELLNIIVQFRQELRQTAITRKDQEVLMLCDSVRDSLKKVGYIVKDHGKVSSVSKC